METKTNASTVKELIVKPVGLTSKVSDLRKEAEAKKQEPVNSINEKKEVAKVSHVGVSAEMRIKKLENFSILAKRYQALKAKSEELTKFKLANDGTRIKLILKAENVEPFVVTNSETLNTAMEIVQKDLLNRISTTEKEIESFNI